MAAGPPTVPIPPVLPPAAPGTAHPTPNRADIATAATDRLPSTARSTRPAPAAGRGGHGAGERAR